jgi:hypothetical protein
VPLQERSFSPPKSESVGEGAADAVVVALEMSTPQGWRRKKAATIYIVPTHIFNPGSAESVRSDGKKGQMVSANKSKPQLCGCFLSELALCSYTSFTWRLETSNLTGLDLTWPILNCSDLTRLDFLTTLLSFFQSAGGRSFSAYTYVKKSENNGISKAERLYTNKHQWTV